MKKVFSTVFAAIALLSLVAAAPAPKNASGTAAAAKTSVSAAPEQSDESLLQGYESYRNGDWTSSMFFLRKAVAVAANSTDETWYMLIMSEMYAGEYKTAQADCDQFGSLFSLSPYMPLIQYQKGRALHYNGQNEQAVLVLSDFCHQNSGSELYASALYWIAESFYAEYNYDSARALYERIVADFPADSKAPDAQYRIETIDQRGREGKLLYLLKVTGEEYLASKEEYERQLKQYKTEDMMGVRRQLAESQARVAELEKQLGMRQNGSAQQPAGENADPEVEALKKRAQVLQTILDEKTTEETKQ